MRSSPELWYLQPFRLPADHAHAIQVLHTCRALAESGARVRLWVKRAKGPRLEAHQALAHYGLAPHPGLRIEWLPGRGHTASGLAARWRVATARGAPVFYARHPRLARTAARWGRGRVVVELHGLGDGAGAALAAADGVVVIDSALRERVQERYAPRAPVEVIGHGVDAGWFGRRAPGGRPRVVYAGSLAPWKGVDVLLRALAEVPELEAVVVGGRQGSDPGRDALRDLAGRLGLARRVQWAGSLPPPQVAEWLRAGDIGVVPTRERPSCDATPLKLLEGMAAGLAVVASDLPGIRALIADGEHGRLFPEGDAAALAARLRELAGDREARLALGERARERACRHTWRERAERILAFAETLRTGATR